MAIRYDPKNPFNLNPDGTPMAGTGNFGGVSGGAEAAMGPQVNYGQGFQPFTGSFNPPPTDQYNTPQPTGGTRLAGNVIPPTGAFQNYDISNPSEEFRQVGTGKDISGAISPDAPVFASPEGNLYTKNADGTYSFTGASGPSYRFTPSGTAGKTSSGTQQGQQSLIDIMKQLLQGMYGAGYQINPNAQITPQAVTDFMSLAKANINLFLPYAQAEDQQYFSDQLKLAKDSFLQSQGFNAQQILQQEQIAERNYGLDLKTLSQTEADKGFALSGERRQQEGLLAQTTQEGINLQRQKLTQDATQAAGQFAQSYGTSNVPQIKIGATPQVTAGQPGFNRDASSLPLYNLSPNVYAGLTGTQQYQQQVSEQNRASQLEGAFRQYQATPIPTRQINL